MGEIHFKSYEEFQKIQNDFIQGVEKERAAIEKEISEVIAKEIYNDTLKACEHIINSWYSSYSPLYYERLYSLKNAIKVTLNGTYIEVYGDTDALGGHHLNSEGLYNLTMEEGSHGGSMYRGPLNYWNHPTRPAVVTFSPVDAISEWLHSYTPKAPMIQKLNSIFRKYYSKYKYFQLFY